MCGLIALVCRDNADFDSSNLALALQHMRPRGPDAEGLWVDQTPSIVLGHRRLAILDLSPTGHQPMLDASGELSIVFNSEIYNFSVH